MFLHSAKPVLTNSDNLQAQYDDYVKNNFEQKDIADEDLQKELPPELKNKIDDLIDNDEENNSIMNNYKNFENEISNEFDATL